MMMINKSSYKKTADLQEPPRSIAYRYNKFMCLNKLG